MEGSLHPTPQVRDVLREQIRILGRSLRREALVAAAVLGIVTLRIVVDMAHGNAGSWFDSDEWFPVALAAFLFPFAVWRRDRRFAPAFLWTLPVDRRRLALTKVFAGWLWMLAALTAVVVWQSAVAFAVGVSHPQIMPLTAFAGSTAMYLLGSAVVIGLRYPVRWLFATGGVIAVAGMLNHRFGPDQLPHALANLPQNVERLAPLLLFLWLVAGLVALWAAVARHGEQRRH